MRLDILNSVEAEEYASRVLDDFENYQFCGRLQVSYESPELAYEMVNRNTELWIEGMSEMGEAFEEDRFSFDVLKSNYSQEFVDLVGLSTELENGGYEYHVEFDLEVEAETPDTVVEKVEKQEIHPTVQVEDVDSTTTISYRPRESTRFQVDGDNSELATLIAELS